LGIGIIDKKTILHVWIDVVTHHQSGPLLQLCKFQLDMIRWDGMHIVNLGADLWIIASVLKKMLQYDHVFGGLQMSEADRLLIAYDLFKDWSRRNKVLHLIYVKTFC